MAEPMECLTHSLLTRFRALFRATHYGNLVFLVASPVHLLLLFWLALGIVIIRGSLRAILIRGNLLSAGDIDLHEAFVPGVVSHRVTYSAAAINIR